MRLTLLTTDVFMLGLLVAGAIYAALAYRSAPLRATWRLVFQRPAGLASAIILSLFVGIALVDSVHIRLAIQTPEGQPQRYAEPMSLLDFALKPLVEARERS
ncbi:MAG: ABC transporter permease, partial [Betaproteobacteria bacterium]|nr:ABC transporter permease [Betaproteobacteria bacterium]